LPSPKLRPKMIANKRLLRWPITNSKTPKQ
jgi:hypothetical protein